MVARQSTYYPIPIDITVPHQPVSILLYYIYVSSRPAIDYNPAFEALRRPTIMSHLEDSFIPTDFATAKSKTQPPGVD